MFLATDVAVSGVAITIPATGVTIIINELSKGFLRALLVYDTTYAFVKTILKQPLGSTWFIFYQLIHSTGYPCPYLV